MILRLASLWSLAVAMLAFPVRVRAGEPVPIAVLEFTSKGGVTQDQMDALSDLLVNEFGKQGNFKVIDKGTIRSVLKLEEQKQKFLACTDQECIAEIGGALGVRWVLAGNISQFGTTFLLNLKLIDSQKVQMAAGISRSITGGQEALVSDLPKALRELMQKARGLFDEALNQAGGAPDADQAKVTPPPAPPEKEEPAPPQAEPSGWFPAAPDKTGRFGIHLLVGAAFLGSPDLSADVPTDVGDIEAIRVGPSVRLSASLGFTRWLAVAIDVGWLGGYQSTSSTDRNRNVGDFLAEVRFSWPMNLWLEPYADLGIGFSAFQEKVTSDSDTSHFRGMGVVAALAIGVNIYFTEHWYLGARVEGTLRHYGSLMNKDDEPGASWDTIPGGKESRGGSCVSLNSGWQF